MHRWKSPFTITIIIQHPSYHTRNLLVLDQMILLLDLPKQDSAEELLAERDSIIRQLQETVLQHNYPHRHRLMNMNAMIIYFTVVQNRWMSWKRSWKLARWKTLLKRPSCLHRRCRNNRNIELQTEIMEIGEYTYIPYMELKFTEFEISLFQIHSDSDSLTLDEREGQVWCVCYP